MLRPKRITGYLVIVLLAVVLLTAYALAGCAPAQKSLKMLGAAEGSKAQMAFSYLAKMLSEGTDVTASSLPGELVSNYGLLSKGEADMTLAHTAQTTDIYEGTGVMKGNAFKDVRSVVTIMVGMPMGIVVRADSGILKVEDLLGKRVAYGPPGSGAELAGKIIIETGYGITKQKMEAARGTFINLSQGDMKVQLGDRTVDAVTLSTVPGTIDPVLAAAEALGQGVRFLSPSQQAIDNIRKVYPALETGYIKGGIYKNHPQDILSMNAGYVMIARKQVPDDVIYDFLRIAMKKENAAQVVKMTGWTGFGEKGMAEKTLSAVPLHPGAAKWYRDNGYNITGIKIGD